MFVDIYSMNKICTSHDSGLIFYLDTTALIHYSSISYKIQLLCTD